MVNARPSILLVEDDPTFAAYLTVRLGSVCYDVEWVADGRRALTYLRRTRVDLIIADVALPALDGLSLLEKLRSETLATDTPAIVLTGRYSAQDVEKAAALGVVEYVLKPFDEAVFLQAIASHLRPVRAEDGDCIVMFNR